MTGGQHTFTCAVQPPGFDFAVRSEERALQLLLRHLLFALGKLTALHRCSGSIALSIIVQIIAYSHCPDAAVRTALVGGTPSLSLACVSSHDHQVGLRAW